MDAVDLHPRIAAADLVVTGEGSLDEQSMHGKTAAGVLEACRLARVPAAIVCGRATIDVPGVQIVSLVDRVGEGAALGDARNALVTAAEELAARAGGLAGAAS